MILLYMLLASGCALYIIWKLTESRKNPVVQRLAQIEKARRNREVIQSGPATARSRFLSLLRHLGGRVRANEETTKGIRHMMILAGSRGAEAVSVYHASRLLLAGLLVSSALGVSVLFRFPLAYALLGSIYLGLMGLFIPRFWLKRKISARQRAIRKAVPDALDLLVVCVEAGMGLNQALLRLAEEASRFSHEIADECKILNLEIRAGTPREIALRNLGRRTEVDDLRSLASMLIQADRFGTSVGDALRVHARSTRTKRRQQAEEAAAKTTIKLVIPLVLFVFPSLFVTILGPVALRMMDIMATL